MDLPTYTNIWRIEKRLYKLYDFRLPMPLPVGQIAVFTAIAVPYVVILKVIGLPFSHTLLWLYILPPGALAWLVTRPVLESKRLPELVVSQVRYLSEPRTWCRMAPLAEKDEIVITARVWRRVGGEAGVAAGEPVAAAIAASAALAPAAEASRLSPRPVQPARGVRVPAAPATAPPERTARVEPGRAQPATGVPAPDRAQPGVRVPAVAEVPGPEQAASDRAAAAVRAHDQAVAAAPAADEAVPAAAAPPGPPTPAPPPALSAPSAASISDVQMPPPVSHAPAAPPALPVSRAAARGSATPPATPVPSAPTVPSAAPPVPSAPPVPVASAAPSAPPVPRAPERGSATAPTASGSPVQGAPAAPVGPPSRQAPPVPRAAETGSATAPTPSGSPVQGAPAAPVGPPSRQTPPVTPRRPVVTVTGDQDGERPLRMVERALGNPAERRGSGWHDHVVVVPGGHRPGRPDQLQRDRARARQPVPGGQRVVVLGCTVGAGQTVTALLTGELLVSLRGDPVAVLDLNPGEGSLAERARAVPALTGSRAPAPSRAEVITRETSGAVAALEDVTRVFELVSARYPLTLADPGPAAVPRVLMAAGQLVLVAPASQDAASALATTREWLEAHGHAELADEAIVVLNGVSRHTMPHVEQAEALARGRCRAIVRIPWDDHIKHRAAGPLSPAALHAYTALSGVLIAALAAMPGRLQRVRP